MALVVHVISGLKVGGAEMALLRLIEGSRGGPYRHCVVALTPDGAMRRRFEEKGVDLHVLDFSRRPVRGFMGLVGLLKRMRPDIVQTWMYHADLFGGLAARMAGIRRVIWGVRATDIRAVGSRTTRLIGRVCALLSSAVPDRIVCVAEAARRSHGALGYAAERMVVVHNGFDLARLAASGEERRSLRAECGWGEDELVVGSLGRYNLVKDPGNFVRAAAILAGRFPQVRFLMVGRDVVWANPDLANLIAATGHADRFRLLGEREDVPACLAAMDVFCLHSRSEGFPNVVGEAMAMERPCVVSDVGDAKLLLGETGVVVPRENHEALAAGLERLVRMSVAERTDLGRQARERIRRGFSLESARDRFEAVYADLGVGGVG